MLSKVGGNIKFWDRHTFFVLSNNAIFMPNYSSDIFYVEFDTKNDIVILKKVYKVEVIHSLNKKLSI